MNSDEKFIDYIFEALDGAKTEPELYSGISTKNIKIDFYSEKFEFSGKFLDQSIPETMTNSNRLDTKIPLDFEKILHDSLKGKHNSSVTIVSVV